MADMTAAEALGLRRFQRITIRKSHGKRTYRAMVTGEPTPVDHWVLVPYALASRSHGATVDTYSRVEHVATLGGKYPDHLQAEAD